MNHVKKIILSVLVVGGFGLYAWHAKNDIDKPKTSTVTPTTTKTITNAASATASTASTAVYKDGTYTGSAADAYYGNVQVKITIASGKINDVVFLQFPDNHHESNQINLAALPLLKQETIQAQTAQIDGVSGATDTSQAFVESLKSALDQAKA